MNLFNIKIISLIFILFLTSCDNSSSESTDLDNDGIINDIDKFPSDPTEWLDTDNDNIGDNTDTDIDGDNILNEADAFPLDVTEWLDTDNDTIGDNTDPDIDGDNILNEVDVFPLDASEWLDTDNDAIGDNTDTDIDGDSILNEADAFPLDASEWLDTDNDTIGDNTDPDIDGDGTLNEVDAFPLDASEWLDTDNDAIGDNIDISPYTYDADAYGKIVYSPISGLNYISGTHHGTTNEEGEFGYLIGDKIKFYIGDIQIGSTIEAKELITPYNLAGGDALVTLNIARFLQSLDNDGNPHNGIEIHPSSHILAKDIIIDFFSNKWEEESMSAFLNGVLITLTSETEFGSRNLISSADVDYLYASKIDDLMGENEELIKSHISIDSCNTSHDCKVIGITNSMVSGCFPSISTSLVYSEPSTEIATIDSLLEERDVMRQVKSDLWLNSNINDTSSGLCIIMVNPRTPFCNQEQECDFKAFK